MTLDATGAETVEESAQWGNIAADRLRSLIEPFQGTGQVVGVPCPGVRCATPGFAI